MNYVIGVDGGGTKTEAVAYSLESEELGRGYSGFGNLLLAFDEATDNIIAAIEQCKNSIENDIEENQCIYICLGLAGIEASDNKARIEKILVEKFNCKVRAINDAEIAHAALLKGEDGIMTISGTGSISYGLYKGKKARAGGWGHLLGDEGSGYFIAIEAFKVMTLEEDLGYDRSELTKAMMEKLNIDEVNDIKAFIYSASKGEIAAYTPVVVRLANLGEENSIKILKKAGKELAIMTERLYRKLGINEPIRIGVKGSILTEVNIVKEEFKNYIEANLAGITIVAENISPTKGAYYLKNN